MPDCGNYFLIEHSDWDDGANTEPDVICSVKDENTILTLDSGFFKEFDYDGNLLRRVAGNSAPASISATDTYVAVGLSIGGTNVFIYNYSDLSLLTSASLYAGGGADSSDRVVVLAGDKLYLGVNSTVYRYDAATLAFEASAAISGSSHDMFVGCYDPVNDVIIFVNAFDKIFKIDPSTLSTLDSATLAEGSASVWGVDYVDDWDMYLVNGQDSDVFSLYDTNLNFVRNIDIPIFVEDAGPVAALGRRIYVADDNDPQNYLIVLDYDKIMISYDCLWKEYWISSLDGSYIYTQDGRLGGLMDWSVTSLFRDDRNALTGIAYDNAVGDREVQIRTVPISTGERGHKQMISFNMECANMNSKQGRVVWRNSFVNAYANSPWFRFNKEDVAFPVVSFVDGKVDIKGEIDSGQLARIQRVECRFIATDRRFRRGTKAQIDSL